MRCFRRELWRCGAERLTSPCIRQVRANHLAMSRNMGNGSVPSKEARSEGVANWVQEAIRKTTMNKFTLAALLSLPLLAVGQQRAAADGWGILPKKADAGCATCNAGYAPQGNAGYGAPQGYGGCATCGKGGCGKGGCGAGGCGPLGCFPITLGISACLHSPPPWAGLCSRGCGGGKGDCCGKVPGPWYLYWPDPRGVGIQTGPAFPGWTYESNFTGSVMGFNPAGATAQYPSYWYGR
jgi:hypothetical protein